MSSAGSGASGPVVERK